MGQCSVCNDLQVDSTTNELAEESSRPEAERLLTYVRYVPLAQWHTSATKAGCATCRLIWDILIHVDKELVLELTRARSDGENKEEETQILLDGIIGQTLVLMLDDLPQGKIFPMLELYSHRSLPRYPIIGSAQEVQDQLSLNSCLDLSRRWIDQCQEHHPGCIIDYSEELPTRVLDLGDPHDPVHVRLHERTPGQHAKYVALSYCWGKNGNLTTTTSTIVERKHGIPWGLLPTSFRDAVAITRGLGMRYLWIDALCIIQDDKADWEREAAKMGQVYENAFLTIATDAAPDPTRGIFTPRSTDLVSSSVRNDQRPPRRSRVMEFSFSDFQGDTHDIRVREPLSHNDIVMPRSAYDITYPLMARGWTLQERLLARRTLHFTASEFVFECKESLYCECGCISRDFIGLDGDHSPKVGFERAMVKISRERTSRNSLTNTSREQEVISLRVPQDIAITKACTLIIAGYSTRQLTYISDKLPAISGMAMKFAQMGGSPGQRTYLAGLWLEDLPWLLCWRAFNRRSGKYDPTSGAPTWSWASLETPVIWDHAIFEAESKIEIMSTSTVSQGQDFLGQARNKEITVRGRLQRAKLVFDMTDSAVLGLRNSHGETISFVSDHGVVSFPSICSSSGDEVWSDALQRENTLLIDGSEVACLWVLQHPRSDGLWGLVLIASQHKSATSSGEGGSGDTLFERIGVITQMSWQYRKDEVTSRHWFEGSKEEEVVII